MTLQLKNKSTLLASPKYSPELEKNLKETINAILKKMQMTPIYRPQDNFVVFNSAVKEITASLTKCYEALQKELEEQQSQNKSLALPKILERYPNLVLNLFRELTSNVQKTIAPEHVKAVDLALSNYWKQPKQNVVEHTSSAKDNSFRSEYRRFF